ncbi:helix-turn-helix domain-containing protein [Streptomyces reniochalinae]|uniref:XRE family transcriptional regulator n=1 Tax=Streptomyces reniochalinae TaxID=2250578 RepID=A0A367F2S0_9ACTN|nr:helix-turn-helix transcriptional regulator [Streptomyces reniochalinae]RCG24658.1 XRE family transcriptional regulator [Streptomyces reniochalinae]
MPQKKRQKNASAMKMVGQLLANYRRVAGFTQCGLAKQACVDEETIASIEQGRRPLKSDLAELLDEILGTKNSLAIAVANLPEMDKYPLWAEEFIDREREAIVICSFESMLVPGLLQTEDYAHYVLKNRVPRFTDDEIAEKVAARLERQSILHRKRRPSTSFVLNEGVVCGRLGGDQVWRAQMQHLREWADVLDCSLQIMPFTRRMHAALDGPFVLLETPDHEQLAYMETQLGSQLVSDAGDISRLAQKYAMLRTQAYTQEETKALLDRLLGES